MIILYPLHFGINSTFYEFNSWEFYHNCTKNTFFHFCETLYLYLHQTEIFFFSNFLSLSTLDYTVN